MRALRNICLFVSALLCCHSAYAGNDGLGHAVGLNLRPSYIVPTHGFYNGWNPSGRKLQAAFNADVQYCLTLEGGTYQGIGLGVHSFFANDMMGTPVSLYLFQGAPLFALSEKLSAGYEWNLGLSSGWKNNGAVTASSLNVYINAAVLFTWRLNPHWALVFGPEYTHFSNGDTKFPNGGANTVNLRLGTRYDLKPVDKTEIVNIFAGSGEKEDLSDRMTYDIIAMGGFRADRSLSGGKLHVLNEAFPLAVLQFSPMYNFNRHLAAGLSADLLYDGSADISVSENENGDISWNSPGFLHQLSAGLSVRAELKMPIFAVNIGAGYNVSESEDLKGIYGIFALKGFVTDAFFLNLSYRLSSVNYAHNLTFGLGWRLGSVRK